MSRNRHMISALAAAAVAITAGTASATDVQVRDAAGGENSQNDPGGLYIAPTGARLNARTAGNAMFHDIACGAFGFESGPVGGGGPWSMFMTYCFEPDQAIEFAANPLNLTGVTYKRDNLTAQPGINAAEAAQLEKLWANVLVDSKTSEVKAAAFQAIVWELGVDNSYDLASGTFALGFGQGDMFEEMVRTQADLWFAQIPGWVATTPLDVLLRASSQDLLIPRGGMDMVPLPTAGLMASIGLLGLSSRRRRAMA